VHLTTYNTLSVSYSFRYPVCTPFGMSAPCHVLPWSAHQPCSVSHANLSAMAQLLALHTDPVWHATEPSPPPHGYRPRVNVKSTQVTHTQNPCQKINRSDTHAHGSRTNHSHEHRASNGATTLNSRSHITRVNVNTTPPSSDVRPYPLWCCLPCVCEHV